MSNIWTALHWLFTTDLTPLFIICKQYCVHCRQFSWVYLIIIIPQTIHTNSSDDKRVSLKVVIFSLIKSEYISPFTMLIRQLLPNIGYSCSEVRLGYLTFSIFFLMNMNISWLSSETPRSTSRPFIIRYFMSNIFSPAVILVSFKWNTSLDKHTFSLLSFITGW